MRPGSGERDPVRAKGLATEPGVVPDDSDDVSDRPNGGPTAEIDDTPTVSCSRCDREWDLAYELDDLGVGNQAVEQFALDHKRHTGHFPDDVRTWLASCRRCTELSEHLARHAAERWARTHARHTRHVVEIEHGVGDETTVVEPDDVQ
jgi:hypothetical protein